MMHVQIAALGADGSFFDGWGKGGEIAADTPRKGHG